MALFRVLSCGGLLLLLLWPSAVLATPVLDQLASPDGGSFFQDNDLEPVQSFTVGRTGHLTEIDLWSATTPPNQVCCRLVLASQFSPPGDLFAAEIGEVNIDYVGNTPPLSQGWNAFVFSSPVPVTAGETLYFTISQDNDIEWGTSSYPGGSMTWVCFNDGCIDPANPSGPELQPGDVVYPSSDWAFRTFVPEPAPALLLALAALAATGRRRREPG